MTAPTHSCLNCGAELRGPYCSACGQRDAAPSPTFRELVAEAWDEFTSFDTRLIRTLRLLFQRPGALTLEFLSGLMYLIAGAAALVGAVAWAASAA